MKKAFILIVALLFSHLLTWAQWNTNPAENLRLTEQAGEQVIPKIRKAPNGDYYLGYFSLEKGNYNVRLQHFDSNGNKLWQNEGLLISSHPSMSWLTDWDMAVDHDNHVILTWQDIRMNENNNVVAYRIAPDGGFDWGADGIMLSNNTAFNVSPKVVITAANNAVIAWMSDDNLVRQKLNSSGQKLWGDDGIVMSGTARYTWPQLMAVGTDDVLMKYYEDSGPGWAPTRNLMLQRFNAGGQAVWASPTLVCNSGSITAWTQILSFVPDGNNGCFLAWHDYRLSGTIASGWVQHINSNGQILFAANGAKVSDTDNFNKLNPMAAYLLSTGNVMVFWNEVDGGQNFYGIFAQQFDPTGERLWGNNGKAIVPVSSETVSPVCLLPIENDVVFVYELYLDAVRTNLFARRYNSVGDLVWNPGETMVSTAFSSKVHADIAGFSNNQWVFAWEDDRIADNIELYGQNLRPDGSLGSAGPQGLLQVQVSIEGNMANVTEATVQAGSQMTHPDASGLAALQLLPGVYSVIISHPFTNTEVVDNVVVTENQTASLTVELDMLRDNLILKAVDQYGGSIVMPVNYSVTGPENNYSGQITTGTAVVANVPYGQYVGTAALEPGQNVESSAVLNADNNELIFTFILGGLGESAAIAQPRIVPNPVNTESVLFIESKTTQVIHFQLFDIVGRKVTESDLSLITGVNRFELNRILETSALQKGLYSAVLQVEGMKAMVKMIVQ